MSFFHLEPGFKFLFGSLSSSHSFTYFFCLTAVPLCHSRNKGAIHGKGNDKEKRRVEPNKEKGKGGSCRHLTSSDQNSEADQVDMKFASNKSPPTSLPQALLCLSFPYPCGSYHLSLFFMPASSFHTSSNPSPISPFPSRPRVAFCFTLLAF